MADKKGKKSGTDEKGAEIEVAVAGDGVSPASVHVRETIQVLEAAIALVEAVAKENGKPAPELSLVAIKNSSAGYALHSSKSSDRQVIKRTIDACKRRGEGSSADVRRSLRRLYSAAKTGHVRIGAHLGAKPSVVQLAAPVDGEGESTEVADVVYGHVVAVQVVREENYRVTIRYSDGGSGTFEADAAIAQLAAPLFDRNVRASVTFVRGATDQEGRIEEIEEFEEGDFLELIRNARKKLEESGVHFGTELLKELHEDDGE